MLRAHTVMLRSHTNGATSDHDAPRVHAGVGHIQGRPANGRQVIGPRTDATGTAIAWLSMKVRALSSVLVHAAPTSDEREEAALAGAIVSALGRTRVLVL